MLSVRILRKTREGFGRRCDAGSAHGRHSLTDESSDFGEREVDGFAGVLKVVAGGVALFMALYDSMSL